jgi:hypothetical protein
MYLFHSILFYLGQILTKIQLTTASEIHEDVWEIHRCVGDSTPSMILNAYADSSMVNWKICTHAQLAILSLALHARLKLVAINQNDQF